MSRAVITINGTADREKAARWVMATKPGMRVEFKQAKRSGEQNDKLWAMLTEVAAQVPWHGIKLAPGDWKFIFLDALKRELRMVPNIDGTGFVNLGRSSSDLSKSEMSDLIELIHAFGAQHSVVFRDPESISQPATGEANQGVAHQEPEPQTSGSPNSDSSQDPVSKPPETDKPAVEDAPTPAAAGTLSESASGSGAEGGGDGVSDASPSPLPSDLSPDWRETYLRAMARVNDRPKSLPSRHTEALQLIGGKANAEEQEWMKAVYSLTKRRLQGEITKEDFDAAIREIS
jgi:hypothetical protein